MKAWFKSRGSGRTVSSGNDVPTRKSDPRLNRASTVRAFKSAEEDEEKRRKYASSSKSTDNIGTTPLRGSEPINEGGLSRKLGLTKRRRRLSLAPSEVPVGNFSPPVSPLPEQRKSQRKVQRHTVQLTPEDVKRIQFQDGYSDDDSPRKAKKEPVRINVMEGNDSGIMLDFESGYDDRSRIFSAAEINAKPVRRKVTEAGDSDKPVAPGDAAARFTDRLGSIMILLQQDTLKDGSRSTTADSLSGESANDKGKDKIGIDAAPQLNEKKIPPPVSPRDPTLKLSTDAIQTRTISHEEKEGPVVAQFEIASPTSTGRSAPARPPRDLSHKLTSSSEVDIRGSEEKVPIPPKRPPRDFKPANEEHKVNIDIADPPQVNKPETDKANVIATIQPTSPQDASCEPPEPGKPCISEDNAQPEPTTIEQTQSEQVVETIDLCARQKKATKQKSKQKHKHKHKSKKKAKRDVSGDARARSWEAEEEDISPRLNLQTDAVVDVNTKDKGKDKVDDTKQRTVGDSKTDEEQEIEDKPNVDSGDDRPEQILTPKIEFDAFAVEEQPEPEPLREESKRSGNGAMKALRRLSRRLSRDEGNLGEADWQGDEEEAENRHSLSPTWLRRPRDKKRNSGTPDESEADLQASPARLKKSKRASFRKLIGIGAPYNEDPTMDTIAEENEKEAFTSSGEHKDKAEADVEKHAAGWVALKPASDSRVTTTKGGAGGKSGRKSSKMDKQDRHSVTQHIELDNGWVQLRPMRHAHSWHGPSKEERAEFEAKHINNKTYYHDHHDNNNAEDFDAPSGESSTPKITRIKMALFSRWRTADTPRKGAKQPPPLYRRPSIEKLAKEGALPPVKSRYQHDTPSNSPQTATKNDHP